MTGSQSLHTMKHGSGKGESPPALMGPPFGLCLSLATMSAQALEYQKRVVFDVGTYTVAPVLRRAGGRRAPQRARPQARPLSFRARLRSFHVSRPLAGHRRLGGWPDRQRTLRGLARLRAQGRRLLLRRQRIDAWRDGALQHPASAPLAGDRRLPIRRYASRRPGLSGRGGYLRRAALQLSAFDERQRAEPGERWAHGVGGDELQHE